MTISCEEFRARPGVGVELAERPTTVAPCYKSKKQYKKRLREHVKALTALQRLHYASDRYAVLLILQGMDAAGKDGAIRNVMSGINPQGCEVFSFKQPTAGELEHDFLWRTTRHLPERGRIGIFNRSYYEEVLVVRVHPEILDQEQLPSELLDETSIWQQRYSSIVDLEEHLYRNGTRIIKIFLHESKDEQAARFRARIDAPDKNWKFSESDMHERSYWPQYMQAYQECINATSTDHAPWYVVPADDKKNARLIVSQIVLDTLSELKMAYPTTTAKRHQELESFRAALSGDVTSTTQSPSADADSPHTQRPGLRAARVGLPDGVRACLFDLDGVLTRTAAVHAVAWKEVFDAYLHTRARRDHSPFVAFDLVRDYDTYVDGKPRADGTRSFLGARGIELPEGKPADPPDAETGMGLGTRKTDIVQRRIRDDGVQVYAGSIRYVRAARAAGLCLAVVSSSKNCAGVLVAAGIADLFDQRVDGRTAEQDHLAGKPAPDLFLAAASALGIAPAEAAVFEDALVGVAAGRAGRFGFVVGVDRAGQADALRTHGADVVVADLAELLSAG